MEAHAPGVISIVLLMGSDGKQLWPVAGRRFPAELIPAISPWPVGPNRAACGTAAFLKERVIISDVATDPRWPDEYRNLAVRHGLRAAWSEPLFAKEGEVLGTFAMYYAEKRVPDTGDLELITAAGHIASIAIQLQKAQEALRESENRFRLAANTAPVMIWMAGLDRKCTYLNQCWLDFTGRSEADLLNDLAQVVHPEDLGKCHEIYERAFAERQPFRKECRLQRHDGEYRWIADIGVPRYDEHGSFVGYIGTAVDVTVHKQAEESLSNLNRRLIEAQESERSRLARELHDDVGQRLAILAGHLSVLTKLIPASPPELGEQIGDVRKQVQDLAKDIQALSHSLHSSRLEFLGLRRTAAGFCKEVAGRQDVEIDFNSNDTPNELPLVISQCLFRVLQEALQNAIKHSGSKHFKVSLTGRPNEIELRVQDSGIGFEPGKALISRGLGLTSMRERLRLVEGQLSIDAKPQCGTTIQARVPLNAISSSADLH
jgi:PAS domain S-box-containing protein